jgi:hypothetical protein
MNIVLSPYQHLLSVFNVNALLRSIGKTAVYVVDGFFIGIHDKSLPWLFHQSGKEKAGA